MGQRITERPKITVQHDIYDKLIDGAALCVLAALWIVVLLNYDNLPDIIPIHYDGQGNPDGYGEKSAIWLLPVVATILYAALTLVGRFPHAFNYPVKITEQNARRLYTAATKMLRMLNLVLTLVISFIAFKTVFNVNSGNPESGLGGWLLPVMIVALIIPLIYFVLKVVRKKRQ